MSEDEIIDIFMQHINSPPIVITRPQTSLGKYISRRLLLSRQQKFVQRVNKFVIISDALHQAMCAF